MAKDPTPRADMLRAQREARYGHLQAKAEPPTDQGVAPWVKRKPIPYAGKHTKGIAPAPAKKAKKGKKR